MELKNWIPAFAGVTASIAVSILHAAKVEVYPHLVDKPIQDILQYSTNARFYLDRKIPLQIFTETPLTAADLSTTTVRAMIKAFYKTPKMDVDLHLSGTVQQGLLLISMSLKEIDFLLSEWEKKYAPPKDLAALSPKLEKLEFFEGSGFQFTCRLRKVFDYSLLSSIPYSETLKIEDLSPAYKEAAKFIEFMERDQRSRVILLNNTSGQPPMIVLQKLEPDAWTFTLHYPMHDIVWQTNKEGFHYVYLDDWENARALPEIKLLSKQKAVKKFLKEEGRQVRVRGEGNPETGFKVTLTSLSTKRRLTASIHKRKVKMESVP